MHMDPWTKASSSSSGGVWARICRISSSVSSRASTIRLAPSSCHIQAASELTMLVCVEIWMRQRDA